MTRSHKCSKGYLTYIVSVISGAWAQAALSLG